MMLLLNTLKNVGIKLVHTPMQCLFICLPRVGWIVAQPSISFASGIAGSPTGGLSVTKRKLELGLYI